jgi:hypothetical protein
VVTVGNGVKMLLGKKSTWCQKALITGLNSLC